MFHIFDLLDNFFLMGPPSAVPETCEFLNPMEILSYFVASFASYTGIAMGLQLADTKERLNKNLLRMGGAFAFGAGIWAMHFIGMLSYEMKMVITYDPKMTFLSMAIAVVLAFGAISMVGKKTVTMRSLLTGGLLLGLGICLMHFTGMMAMQMDGILRYRPGMFFLSAVIAMSVSTLALYVAFMLMREHKRSAFWYQIAAALVMGGAIWGMHYTAMLGAVFIPFAECRYDPHQSYTSLAVIIAVITGLILALSLFIGLYRKRVIEGRLFDSETRLRAIIDSSIDAMIGMNERGYIQEWNKQAEAMFGWSFEDVKGKLVTDLLIPEEFQHMYKDGLKEYLKTRINQRLEAIVHSKDGKEFPIESIVTSYVVDNDVNYTAFVRDITDRKQSEKDRALLAAIVQSSDDPIISKTMNGIITSWNPAAEKMFGYEASEVIGCHIRIIIPPERITEEEQIVARLARGEKVEHFETIRRSKNGDDLDLSLTVSPVFNPAGEIIGASKLIRDISERRRNEQAVEQANRRKDEFLTNMSHELRTPMNVVVGLSDILSRTEPLTDKQKHFISTLKASADTLLALINDLLDFSKLEQGAVQLEIINFNLLELMAQIVSLMHVKAKEKKLDIQLNYAPGIPYKLIGDPLRVQQVLINIISNAIKFTKTGGIEVNISCEQCNDPEKPFIVFTITDTGIGIAKEQLGTIFDKFSQADPSITRRYGGSGLGLSIVKELVERMEGSIAVTSEPGKGSRFVIRLPFALNAQEELPKIAARPKKKRDIKDGAKGKILFVEDYAPNTLVGTTLLDQFGYDYDVANNGQQALERFHDNVYDIVLMDIQMPEMDGLEAARQIRAWEKEHNVKQTPIIAMTAHVLDHSRQSYKDVGMNDFIPKPFDADDLERKLALYCNK